MDWRGAVESQQVQVRGQETISVCTVDSEQTCRSEHNERVGRSSVYQEGYRKKV